MKSRIKRQKRPPMLIALRARTGDIHDESLRIQLRRVAEAANCTEAQLIRDGVKAYLDAMEERLKTAPASMARLEPIEATA